MVNRLNALSETAVGSTVRRRAKDDGQHDLGAKAGGFLKRRRKAKDAEEVPDALAFADGGDPTVEHSAALHAPTDSGAEVDFDASINQSVPASLRPADAADDAELQPVPQGSTSSTAAGWFDDPMNSHMVRWWDGSAWTSHVLSRPAAA